MLKVAWLYRQTEVDAKALPADCHPREVRVVSGFMRAQQIKCDHGCNPLHRSEEAMNRGQCGWHQCAKHLCRDHWRCPTAGVLLCTY